MDGSSSYKLEYDGGNDRDCAVGVKAGLKGSGDFISRSYECLIPIEYQNSIVELDKKWGCFNLTPNMTISGKAISKVLDSFELNHNKEEVSSKSYLSVFILKDAAVNDYIKFKEIYCLKHDDTVTYILV